MLPGVGVAWTHDKYEVFEARDGTREPIDPRPPSVVLGCGAFVRVATVICKDALDPAKAAVLGDLGVHFLAVPAMSADVGPFSTASELLIARSQGATVVANNPRVWNDEAVDHALLGHPVPCTPRVVARRSDGTARSWDRATGFGVGAVNAVRRAGRIGAAGRGRSVLAHHRVQRYLTYS